jgi:hypothetical protein
MAGKKICDIILSEESSLSVTKSDALASVIWDMLVMAAKEYAYDAFISLKEEILNRHEETHRKYMYALNLRIDAAGHIGIENIKNHKLIQLEKERVDTEREYTTGKMLCPEFRPVLVIKMEGGND